MDFSPWKWGELLCPFLVCAACRYFSDGVYLLCILSIWPCDSGIPLGLLPRISTGCSCSSFVHPEVSPVSWLQNWRQRSPAEHSSPQLLFYPREASPYSLPQPRRVCVWKRSRNNWKRLLMIIFGISTPDSKKLTLSCAHLCLPPILMLLWFPGHSGHCQLKAQDRQQFKQKLGIFWWF